MNAFQKLQTFGDVMFQSFLECAISLNQTKTRHGVKRDLQAVYYFLLEALKSRHLKMLVPVGKDSAYAATYKLERGAFASVY